MEEQEWWSNQMCPAFIKQNCARNLVLMDTAHMEWDANLFMNSRIQMRRNNTFKTEKLRNNKHTKKRQLLRNKT